MNTLFEGNINLEEFVQIYVQMLEGEDTGEEKTQWEEDVDDIDKVETFTYRDEMDGVIEKAEEMFAMLDDSGDGEVSQVRNKFKTLNFMSV